MKIPWLYSINLGISVQNSTIKIGTPNLEEKIRDVVWLELIFYNDYNLLIYTKKYISGALPILSEVIDLITNMVQDSNSVKVTSSEESNDDLSDIEDLVF